MPRTRTTRKTLPPPRKSRPRPAPAADRFDALLTSIGTTVRNAVTDGLSAANNRVSCSASESGLAGIFSSSINGGAEESIGSNRVSDEGVTYHMRHDFAAKAEAPKPTPADQVLRDRIAALHDTIDTLGVRLGTVLRGGPIPAAATNGQANPMDANSSPLRAIGDRVLDATERLQRILKDLDL